MTTSDPAGPGRTPRWAALVVDFGGVLTTPLQDAMAAFCAENAIDLQDLVRAALGLYSGADDDLVADFETGRISEAEFSRGFADRLAALTGKSFEPEGLVARLFGTLKLEDGMLDAVAAVRRAGLRTALLSNSWGDGLYRRDVLDPLFDVVVISGEVGLRKPDPGIFELTAARLGVPADACLFVDDHPGHLDAAAHVGMTPLLHGTPSETRAALARILGVELGPYPGRARR